MKIGFISLGCPKNQLDTEVMLNELRIAGYEITPDETEADIIVVNTCAFIEAAKRESIDNILDAAWLKKNHTLRGLIVTGCMAERYRDEVLKEFPEVDAVLGVGSIHDIVDAVREVGKGQRGYSSFLPKDEVKLGGDRVLTTPQFWTYLKIAEGCDNRCTYCAIPSIRGKFRSRPIEKHNRAGHHPLRCRSLRRIFACTAFARADRSDKDGIFPPALLLPRQGDGRARRRNTRQPARAEIR